MDFGKVMVGHSNLTPPLSRYGLSVIGQENIPLCKTVYITGQLSPKCSSLPGQNYLDEHLIDVGLINRLRPLKSLEVQGNTKVYLITLEEYF